MASFGFNSPAPTLDQVDYGNALNGGPPSAIDAYLQAAPAPQPTAQAPAPLPGPAEPQAAPAGYHPGFWDVLQGMWFDGLSPARAALQARQIHYQNDIAQQMPAIIHQLPPGVQAAALLGGPKVWEEIVKNYAPQTRSAGQQTDYFGGRGQPGGYTNGTPTYGIDDKSGVPGVYGPGVPGGYQALGPSLGGDIRAEGGIVNSSRLGPTGQTYSTPITVAPGASGVPFTPTLGGTVPQSTAPTMVGNYGQPGGAQPPMQQPRGIRNQNLGNLKTPASGPWQGQTGVDKDGYAIFADPLDGARAALTNLQAYAKQGVNTVSGVVSRWGPASAGNNTGAYANFVAAQMGVKPDQQLDMNDPKVQRGLLTGIFNFENTPAAMQAYRYRGGQQGAQPGAGQQTAQASGGGYGQPFFQGKQPRVLSPAEAEAEGYARGTVVERAPDGTTAVRQDPKAIQYAQEGRAKYFASPEYQDYINSVNAVNALEQNIKVAKGNTSIFDQAATDAMVRAMTGLSARQGSVNSLLDHLPLSDNLYGRLQRTFGNSYLTPRVVMQMRDAIHAYADGHKALAQQRLDSENDFAKTNGYSLGITLPTPAPASRISWLDGNESGVSGRGAPPAPAKGEVRGGYRFIGGDPANPKSWGKVGG